jgi:hypothetical protein
MILTKEEEQQIIKKEYEQIKNYIDNLSSSNFHDAYSKIENLDRICPYCNGKNISENYNNVHGKIKGETTGSFGLFCGSIYGWIDGKIQTGKTYYCLDCHKAWKKPDISYKDESDIVENLLYPFYFYFEDLEDIDDFLSDFDPDNPEEEYKTYKEARIAKIKEIEDSRFNEPSILRNFHPETIKWLVKNEYFGKYDFYDEILNWGDNKFKIWGCPIFEKPVFSFKKLLKNLFND